MSEIVVVVEMQAKPGHAAEVREGLRSTAAHTHGEPGCLRYALHRSLDDPARIVLIERWRSRADLDAHRTQPYIQALAASEELLECPPRILLLEGLSAGDPVKGAV